MLSNDFNLKLGDIENTNYVISYRIEENQKILDIIYTALSLTSEHTGEEYVFFDNFGKLTLKNVKNMTLPLILDLTSEPLEYFYQTSIDDDVYNSIKVSVSNSKYSYNYTYTSEDSSNKEKWGTLQLFKKLASSYTEAQAKEYANNLLKQKNRLVKEMNVKCIGNASLQAGNVITIKLDEENYKTMIVSYCKHIIKNNAHIMELSFSDI